MRLGPRQRGYNYAWEKVRKSYLAQNPLCVIHLRAGKIVPANVVDHIKPHNGNQALFWDTDNWQGLCKPCHDSVKQHVERGGAAYGADGWPTNPEHQANTGYLAPKRRGPMSHPLWFRASMVPLTIVCGPPGAGKSTYVQEHKGDGDRVICFDTIAKELFGIHGSRRPHSRLSGSEVGDVLRVRNEQLGDLMWSKARERWDSAWLIVNEPYAVWRQWWQDHLAPQSIVVLLTDADVCKARVQGDAARGDVRHADTYRVIDRWWNDYVPRVGDVVITNNYLK